METKQEMKKSTKIVYIVLLVLLILLPAPFYGLFGKYIPSGSNENRELAEMPVLSAETLSRFPGDFETYLNDHLPFKNQLVVLNGIVDYRIFNTSASPYVIVGKNGWLFFKGQGVNNEDPVRDYQGTNKYTQEQLEQIRTNMLKARDFLAERGTEFYIYIAPNKERVYSEYMPRGYGEPAQDCRMQQVIDYLKETTDLTVISPYQELMAYKEAHPETQLYYKYDTHWNHLGAYVGCRVLDEALGYEMPPLNTLEITQAKKGYFDLATLLGLRNVLRDDEVPVPKGYTARNMHVDTDGEGSVFRYWNEGNNATDKKVFLLGDSFTALMGQYLACNYNNTYVDSYLHYDIWMLRNEQPDILVFECVERYMDNLLHFDLEGQIGLR